jgi:DNA-binding LacI/PurR family transcriptional regulator
MHGSGTYARLNPASAQSAAQRRTADVVHMFTDRRPHVGGALDIKLTRMFCFRQMSVLAFGDLIFLGDRRKAYIAELWEQSPPRAVLLHFVDAPRDDLVRALAPPQTRVITSFRTGLWEPPRWHTANPDFYNAYHLATDHLLRAGHRRIGFLSKSRIIHPGWRNTRRRRWMFETQQVLGTGHAVREFGRDATMTVHVNRPVQNDPSGIPVDEPNVAAMVKWLGKPDRPTAVVGDDFRIIGLLRAAEQLKLRVPEDLAVVGVGSSGLAQLLRFPCVDLRFDLLAEQIVNLIEIDEAQLGGVVRHITAPPRLLDEHGRPVPERDDFKPTDTSATALIAKT